MRSKTSSSVQLAFELEFYGVKLETYEDSGSISTVLDLSTPVPSRGLQGSVS